ncbi:MAG: hypothetical protein ACOCV1_05605 [Bacillota bacterium]
MLKIRNIYAYIKQNKCILMYLVILSFIIYAFLEVIFNLNNTLHLLITILLGIFVIIGFFVAYKKEDNIKLADIKLIEWDSLGVIAGVLSTYFLVEYLNIPVIIASAFVGIIGHAFFREFEAAIYMGSFAGMISPFLFNYFDVLILAFFAAFYFIFTKRILKGYGGKLGTTAFLASISTSLILQKSFNLFIVNNNFILLLIVAIFGVLSTYIVQHKLNQTAVIASAFTSFIFAGILFILEINTAYAAIFFTASFVGMANRKILPNLFTAFIAALIQTVIFYLFAPVLNGAGGKMGMMAFVSVLITTSFIRIYQLTFKSNTT